MSDFFAYIELEERTSAANQRKAAALAVKRAQTRFGRFLGQAVDRNEFAVRLALIEGDLHQVVADAQQEANHYDEGLINTVVARLTPDALKEQRTAATKESVRRPRMCPYHKSVTEISLAEGKPSAGYSAMAQHSWGPQHCESEDYKGDSCKFRPEFTTQSFWEERTERARERREQRELEQQALEQTVSPEAVEVEETPVEAEEPNLEGDLGDGADVAVESPEATSEGMLGDLEPVAAGVIKEAPGKQHLPGASDKRNRQYEHIKASCLADGKSEKECAELAARTVNKQRSEHGETKGSSTGWRVATETTGLDGPSPTFDKDRHAPEVPETDKGTPWPTKHKDIAEPTKATNADGKPKEIGEGMTEHQDVAKDTGPSPVKDNNGWGGGQKSIVTESATDVDKNPLREYLADDAFPSDDAVTAAITAYEDGE
jgi:hypothetical protein